MVSYNVPPQSSSYSLQRFTTTIQPLSKEKIEIWNNELQNFSNKIDYFFDQFNKMIIYYDKPFEYVLHINDFYSILKAIAFSFQEFQCNLINKKFNNHEIEILNKMDYISLNKFINEIESLGSWSADSINDFYNFFQLYRKNIQILSSISPKIKNKLDLIITDIENYMKDYISAITIDQQSLDLVNYLNDIARKL